MKIITLHCDYIKFKALKKAIKDAEELKDKNEKVIKECLVVLTAVEKGDTKNTLKSLISALEKTAKEVKTKNVVLYPYAHLSSSLSSPKLALELLQEAEKQLGEKFKTTRAPFGYYKSFELKVKGHPLSELSKEFKPSITMSTGEVVEEDYNISQLLNEISRTKLDTSKLKENDHRIIGQKLDLFSFNEAAPGAAFWHDNGLFIFNKLVDFKRKLLKAFNYEEVSTPQILDNKLWKVSGHWKHFRENMFLSKYEGRDFGIKPMNCPGGMLIYRSRPRSYKDLPLRFAEIGTVHRQELSGVLSGLFRVNRFTQDDAHIFCTKEQLQNEIESIIKMIDITYSKVFNFKYSIELSTKPKKAMGSSKEWEWSESILEKALKKTKTKYKINKGDGAFYGPKIDFHITDSLNRSWQCATIQLDMQMPQRFEISYTAESSKKETPVVLHRVIYGSVERFIGVLLEHLNGNLPLWLSPRQVCVINFTDKNKPACSAFVESIKKQIPELRISTDFRTETVQSRIRDAEMLKYNYVIVIGDKEEKSKTIAVRLRGQKPKFNINPEDFFEDLRKEMNEPYSKI